MLPISLLALAVSCAGAFLSAILMAQPVSPGDWTFCVELSVAAGLVSGVIIAICALFVPRKAAVKTVLAGALVSSVLVALYLNRLFAAWASV